MKRREFVQRVGVGSAALIAGVGAASAPALAKQDDDDHDHDHGRMEGRLAAATVSFGAWPTTGPRTPLDRMNVPDAPAAPNVHALIPFRTTIKAGGSVNFVIAGFHQVVVYAPPTRPADIDTSVLIPIDIPDPPPGLGLIDFPENRVYRGLHPLTVPQDRVEVVHFEEPGRYLVICAVSFHFINDDMFGWVHVR